MTHLFARMTFVVRSVNQALLVFLVSCQNNGGELEQNMFFDPTGVDLTPRQRAVTRTHCRWTALRKVTKSAVTSEAERNEPDGTSTRTPPTQWCVDSPCSLVSRCWFIVFGLGARHCHVTCVHELLHEQCPEQLSVDPGLSAVDVSVQRPPSPSNCQCQLVETARG